MLKRNLVFDQSLAFLAGALTPLLPLLDSGKSLLIMFAAALLGGVVGLRLFRNTAFGDMEAAKRAESLATASKTQVGSPYPMQFPKSIDIPNSGIIRAPTIFNTPDLPTPTVTTNSPASFT